MRKFKQKLSDTLVNVPGWRTKRKIVIIQSDDWGSIRMPSKKVFNKLLDVNIRVDQCPFCSYDSLESEDDLTSLYEVLESKSDRNGCHPVITANCVVANPDFLKISESNFKEYYYEHFTETFRKYPNHKNSFLIWEQGIASGLFSPQLHGREHLNVNRWMRALSEGSREMLIAFDHNLFGINSNLPLKNGKSIMAAFDADNLNDYRLHEDIISDAANLFKMYFKYSSETFVAPNYIWPESLENIIFNHNIKVIQSSRLQQIPDFSLRYRSKYHFTGQRNKLSQVYVVRNCLFEPSIYPNIDWVSACCRHIKEAFFWSKPAVISTHRVNFIGSIVERNRRCNLILLSELLDQIIRNWPDVEFFKSQELGDLILNS